MKEATASTAGEKNATQLLTQYGLLSSDLGSSTSSVEIREPQQPQSQDQQNVGTSEAEVDQMVRELTDRPSNTCVLFLVKLEKYNGHIYILS